jgi:hypothetical protein
MPFVKDEIRRLATFHHKHLLRNRRDFIVLLGKEALPAEDSSNNTA